MMARGLVCMAVAGYFALAPILMMGVVADGLPLSSGSDVSSCGDRRGSREAVLCGIQNA